MPVLPSVDLLNIQPEISILTVHDTKAYCKLDKI